MKKDELQKIILEQACKELAFKKYTIISKGNLIDYISKLVKEKNCSLAIALLQSINVKDNTNYYIYEIEKGFIRFIKPVVKIEDLNVFVNE